MKIGIVGSGFVGSTAAYALVLNGIGREVVLVDVNQARAQSEADDIFHAVPFARDMEVRAGEYRDLAGSRVVIIAAGANQKPGETRLQLLERNAHIFRSLVPQVLAAAPDALLVVATNPVDIMTHLTSRFAAAQGVPSTRIIGSGTTLDTARFRVLIARHVGVDARHVHGYVIGEHGDSEVLTWSLATVAGFPLADFCRERDIVFDAAVRQQIDTSVRRAAYHIISGKGATYYGIGAALARIVQVILGDQRSILTIATRHDQIEGVPDVTLSVPQLLGGQGVLDTFNLPLNAEERHALANSARVVRQAIDSLVLD